MPIKFDLLDLSTTRGGWRAMITSISPKACQEFVSDWAIFKFLFIIKYTSIYVAKMLENEDNIVF